MTTPLPGNSSQTARLMAAPPGFAVGWQEPVYIPDPAAGAVWDHVVDGRYSERLVSVAFALTTSAVVGSRFPQVELVDTNGKVVLSVPAGDTVVASSTVNPVLMLNAPAFAFGSAGGTFGFIPDILVPPGWSWQLVVFGIDPGDQVSDVILVVQRFPNDATSITAGE